MMKVIIKPKRLNFSNSDSQCCSDPIKETGRFGLRLQLAKDISRCLQSGYTQEHDSLVNSRVHVLLRKYLQTLPVLESQFSPTLMNVKLSKLRKLWVCFPICRVGISYRTYLIGRFQFYLSCPWDGFEDVKQYLARSECSVNNSYDH